MLHFSYYTWWPFFPQIALWVLIVTTMFFMLYRYRKEQLALFFIVLCWPSAFIFLGKDIQNVYKVLMLAYTLYIFTKTKASKSYAKKDVWIIGAFILFTAQFFGAVLFFSQNTFTIIFAQYARYIEALLIYFILKKAIFYDGKRDLLLHVFYEIGLAQILISVIKWLLFQTQVEGWVGSFSIIGGAMGTTIPLMWFLILWTYRNGKFVKWDWLYIIGLLIIGFTTGKRAIMFILPVVVFLFMFYVKGIKLQRYMIVGIALVPLLFYLGVRLTPTLNPEHKVWGSFDWEYAWGYAEAYQFGEEGMEGQLQMYEEEAERLSMTGGQIIQENRKIVAQGRGGSTIELVKLLLGFYPSQEVDWWGIGFKNMYGLDYATFAKLPITIQLNHKGSATGFFQSYVTTGLFGAFCAIILGFSFLFYTKRHRLKIALIGMCAWEYFMYTGTIFREPAFMACILITILISNQDFVIQKYRKNVG